MGDGVQIVATRILGLALVPVTWWLLGDLSSPGFDPEELDYIFRAPETLNRHATAAGVTGLFVTAGCVMVLGWQYRKGGFDRRELTRVTIAVGLGFWTGMAARVFTAGGIGANIGGGIIFLATILGIILVVVNKLSHGSPSA